MGVFYVKQKFCASSWLITKIKKVGVVFRLYVLSSRRKYL